MLAHIAGIPAEEAALSLAPVVATIAGSLGLRRRLHSVLRRQSARDAGTPQEPGSANAACAAATRAIGTRKGEQLT